MRQNFSENWFDILKDEGGPRPANNPNSLYSIEEIEEEYDNAYNFRETYGGAYPSGYLGNFKPLGDLRADYNIPHVYGDRAYFNYGITKIEFRVVLSNYESLGVMMNIFVIVHSSEGIKNISWVADEEIKVLSDFVEIYNQPNHKYKNLTATIALEGNYRNRNLKNVISGMTSLTRRERYLLTRLKV